MAEVHAETVRTSVMVWTTVTVVSYVTTVIAVTVQITDYLLVIHLYITIQEMNATICA